MRNVTGILAALVMLGAACSAPRGTPSPSEAASTEPVISAEPTASSAPEATATPTPAPATWTELGATGPAAREDHTWTVTGDGSVAYLFGGRDGSTVYDDLWAYDLEADAWMPIEHGAQHPAARFGHEAAWVDGIGLVVVFGQAGTTFFDDIWAFDPAVGSWEELPSGGAVPRARYGSCAAVGPDGRLWISHGFTADGARFADTVAYDFTANEWTDETPAGDAPVSRCLHGCWWTDAGTFRLYAGQTTGVTALGDLWELAGAGDDLAWRRLEGELPAERNLYARARVGAARLVFGGQGIDGGYLDDLFMLPDDAHVAAPFSVAGSAPPARAGAELVYDAQRERALLFGGRDGDGARADLWELSGVREGE
jgi:hypothetical protein